MIIAIRKLTLPKSGKTSPMVREVRDFKNFVQNDFIHDISQLLWDSINQFANLFKHILAGVEIALS